ncbi:hypothetical protein AAF712_010070 [Marasmius tenuissimus]|uniref:U1-type domain-containing protein n=1 Tax=Marasmius tenuissimus TaxID=585030 RepID=A0ABR2ZPP1_9AGAR
MPSELLQTKWTCTVCNREMGLLSRRSHLQGKAHLAKVAASESTATHEIGSGNDNITGTSAGALPGVWTCMTCNCQMPVSCRETYVQGQPHLKKASAPPSASTNDELRSKLEYWTCTICDCHVPLGSREMHLKGKPHLKKATRAKAPTFSSVSDPPPADPEPVSATHGMQPSRDWVLAEALRSSRMTTLGEDREQHLQGKQHKVVVERSDVGHDTGTIRSVSMNAGHRERHLKGDMDATELASRRVDGDHSHINGEFRVTGRGGALGRHRRPARGRGSGSEGGGGGPGRGGSDGEGRGGGGGRLAAGVTVVGKEEEEAAALVMTIMWIVLREGVGTTGNGYKHRIYLYS